LQSNATNSFQVSTELFANLKKSSVSAYVKNFVKITKLDKKQLRKKTTLRSKRYRYPEIKYEYLSAKVATEMETAVSFTGTACCP
jgi:hypothetical protein